MTERLRKKLLRDLKKSETEDGPSGFTDDALGVIADFAVEMQKRKVPRREHVVRSREDLAKWEGIFEKVTDGKDIGKLNLNEAVVSAQQVRNSYIPEKGKQNA